MQQMQEGVENPPKILFEVGERVRVDRPFTDFNGAVDEVNYERNKLRVGQILKPRYPGGTGIRQVEKLKLSISLSQYDFLRQPPRIKLDFSRADNPASRPESGALLWQRKLSAISSCSCPLAKANPSPPIGPALGQQV